MSARYILCIEVCYTFSIKQRSDMKAPPPKKIAETNWLVKPRLPFLDLRGYAKKPRTRRGRFQQRLSIALSVPLMLMFLLPGFYFLPRALAITLDGVDVEATVYEGDYHWSKSRGDVWHVRYRYTYRGRLYQAQNSVSPVSEDAFQVGDAVRVRVSDRYPVFHVPQERPHWYAKMWFTAALTSIVSFYLSWSIGVSWWLHNKKRR